jgi:hypothetical protein
MREVVNYTNTASLSAGTIYFPGGASSVSTSLLNEAPWGADRIAVVPYVNAFANGTSVNWELQWSMDGVHFYSADNSISGSTTQLKDIFATALTATGYGALMEATVKAPYYAVAQTTVGTFSAAGNLSYGLYDAPISAGVSGAQGSNQGYEAGAPAFAAPSGSVASPLISQSANVTLTRSSVLQIGALGPSPTQQAAALLPNASRMSLLLTLSATGGTFTSCYWEVQWSFDNVNWLHAQPIDSITLGTSAASCVKELSIKAPYMSLVPTIVGSGGTATYQVPFVCQTAA